MDLPISGNAGLPMPQPTQEVYNACLRLKGFTSRVDARQHVADMKGASAGLAIIETNDTPFPEVKKAWSREETDLYLDAIKTLIDHIVGD